MKNLVAQAAVACAPMRAEATDRSEMVNQLLIGELAKIIDETELWVKLIKERDGYIGWCNKNELFIPTKSELLALKFSDFEIAAKPSHFEAFKARNTGKPNHIITVLPGSPIILDIEKAVLSYPFGEFEVIDFLTPLPTNNLISTALAFLGTPYLWGGLSTHGIDCSGFTQTVAALHSIQLPRDASQQAKSATNVSNQLLLDTVEPADLLFFNPSKSGNISHVGFYLGGGLLLHASGCVRVDSLLKETASKEVSYNQRYGESICSYLRISK